jgi:hypothetical protein
MYARYELHGSKQYRKYTFEIMRKRPQAQIKQLRLFKIRQRTINTA